MGICNQIFPMKKEKIKSRNYNIASNVLILFVFFFTLFSFGNVAYGATIFYNTNGADESTNVNGGASGIYINTFYTGSGELGTLRVYLEWDGAMDIGAYVTCYAGTNGGGANNCGNGDVLDTGLTYITKTGASQGYVDWDFSSFYLQIPTDRYLKIVFFGSNYPTALRVHGSTGDSDPDQACSQGCGGLSDFEFYLSDQFGIPPPDTSSRIDTFTYATSTQTVNITGYWNATSTPNIHEELEFWQESTALGQESYVNLTATTTGAFNFTFPYKILPTPGGATTTATILETIYFKARLSQVNTNYYDPFGLGGLDTSLYRSILDSASATLTELTHDLDLPIGLLEYPEYECAITSITGCLKNAGIWLFYPSSQKIEQFKSLSSDLQGKFPFAYAYGVNQMRQELFSASSTPQTISLTFKIIPGHGTSTLELISQDKLSAVPYANTVKTILGWILWLLAIEYIYYRVIRAHDPNTPS